MNILLITTDQQRADTLGCAGSPLAATPRLDACRPRLARAVLRVRARRAHAVRPQPAHRRADGAVELDLRATAVRPPLRTSSLPGRLGARRRTPATHAARGGRRAVGPHADM